MSNNCCVSVPPDSSFQVLTRRLPDWQQRLGAGLHQSIQASDQTFGHLEEESLHKARALERDLREESAQQRADQTPSVCPQCGAYVDRTEFPLPSLMLLDLKLPHVIGLDVLKWIRAQPKLHTVIVSVFTSFKLLLRCIGATLVRCRYGITR